MKPLLVCNVEIYRGPKVPLNGLNGMVFVEGMNGMDEVVICTDIEHQTVIKDGEYGPLSGLWICAERKASSGQEVTVWVS